MGTKEIAKKIETEVREVEIILLHLEELPETGSVVLDDITPRLARLALEKLHLIQDLAGSLRPS